MRAGHRAMLWWLVSAKLLLGLLPLPALELDALAVPAIAVEAVSAARPLVSLPRERSGEWLLWAWIAVATLFVASAAPGWRRARSWRATGRRIDDPDRRLAMARATRAVRLR